MKEQSASGLLGNSIEKIKDLVDVSAIVGDPIVINDKLQVIPVSKVSYGFATGGSDFPSKKTSNELFGGGGGAGITISPVAFLVINDGSVTIRYLNAAEGSVERAIGMIPDVVDKASEVITKLTHKDDDSETVINDAVDEFIDKN
ncbi:MAG: sporulation protein YtfJ [Clostridia bacterium]|jgi:sporulation protein YtfJ|nr:sporulation protein YtfJ [Clostridia bacterium]MBQ4245212.1 sporulation protein YtfJ [Clostridia bacterium]